MIINIAAIVGAAVIVYFGAIQGLARALATLAAAVIAGVLAFGFFGPAAALLPSGSDKSIWFFAADGFCLWAIFCVAFLALRTAAGRWLREDPGFHTMIDRVGGAAVAAPAALLVVGTGLVVAQMLPVAPDFLGYAPFEYVRGTSDADPERVERGPGLWLPWDRAALGLFNYLSAMPMTPLMGDDASVYARVGDVYPPEALRTDDTPASLDADDFLYFHWYRRWQAVQWRGGTERGPMPDAAATAAGGKGMVLKRGQRLALYGMDVRLTQVGTADAVENFPDTKPPAGQEWLMLGLQFKPDSPLPRLIDTRQFTLIDAMGATVARDPMVSGLARRIGKAPTGGEAPVEIPARPSDAAPALRNVRFGFADARTSAGRYLADGAAFTFTTDRHSETRTLIFAIPAGTGMDDIRLFMDATPPDDAAPAPTAPPAPAT